MKIIEQILIFIGFGGFIAIIRFLVKKIINKITKGYYINLRNYNGFYTFYVTREDNGPIQPKRYPIRVIYKNGTDDRFQAASSNNRNTNSDPYECKIAINKIKQHENISEIHLRLEESGSSPGYIKKFKKKHLA